MARAEVVARVRDLAGPLGPFQSFDEQLRRTDDWLRSLGDTAVDDLLDLVTTPVTADERQTADDDVVTAVLGELLCRLAELRPAESIPRLAAYLDNDRTRSLAADALGSTRSPEAVHAIAGFLQEEPDLDPQELLPLVEAAAEVGGSEAVSFLRRVSESLPAGPEAQPVRDRIDELLV